jgi:hypothetical protein
MEAGGFRLVAGWSFYRVGPDGSVWTQHGKLKRWRRRQASDLCGVDRMPKLKQLKALDAVADIVLAYRPKPKTKPARRRKRRAAKIAKAE